jgi:PadR family transcriptional regulator PadR
MDSDGDLFESLRAELRRGALGLAVLARLRVERYGYSLRQALSEDGLEMEESTLYPLLRRLESQGLLASEWREEDKRKKRFYRLSPAGETMLRRLAEEWRGMNASLDKIIGE